MGKNDIVKKIMFECIAGDGFLVQLRAKKFLPQQFNELLSALMEYRENVRGIDLIDRAVAYCVFALDNELSNALDFFPGNKNDYQEIEKAIEISTPVIFEILIPEWMTGPLPNEYK